MDDRIAEAFNRRLDIYRIKRSQADPFGEDDCNRHGRYDFAIECIELLAHEAGIKLAPAQAIETQSAMTEGHGPKDKTAVANGDAPK